jgi:hypothetical protein
VGNSKTNQMHKFLKFILGMKRVSFQVYIVSVSVLSWDLHLYIAQFNQFIICQNSGGCMFVSIKEFEEYLGGVLFNVQGPAEKPDDF